MMIKFKKFLHKNFVWLVILLILIIVAVFFGLRKNMDEVVIKDHDVYQYLNGIRVDYTGEITIDKSTDNITQLNVKDISIDLDSTPIYYEDESKTLFPANMAVIFPTQGMQFKVNYYTTLYREVDDIYVKDRSLKRVLTNAILYDGADIYYLVDESKVTFGKNIIDLKPMSYLVVDALNKYVGIYDYDKDTFIEYVENNDEVIISASKYRVNASLDLMYYNDGSRLFIKTIDKLNNLDK